MYEIYTDGAYSLSRNQGGWAFVIIKDGVKVDYGFSGVKNTTNNRMEILAVIEGIIYAKENNIESFTIWSDSMYVIGTMSLNWKRNKNNDLWEKLDILVKDCNINWQHTKGHVGNKYNELCDTFAVEASKAKLNE